MSKMHPTGHFELWVPILLFFRIHEAVRSLVSCLCFLLRDKISSANQHLCSELYIFIIYVYTQKLISIKKQIQQIFRFWKDMNFKTLC
jgi:hypothetical protein